MSVDLSGADAGVSEHFLERSNVSTAGQKVCREAVTKRVRADFARAADASGITLHQ